jgi:ribosomal protein L33
LYSILPLQLCRTKEEEKGKNMCANVLVKTWFPNDKLNEVVQIYIKAMGTMPSYIKNLGDAPYTRPTKDGIKSYTMMEFPNEKTAEALMEITKYCNRFNSVVGYRWTVETIMGIKEAFQSVGMKLPTR